MDWGEFEALVARILSGDASAVDECIKWLEPLASEVAYTLRHRLPHDCKVAEAQHGAYLVLQKVLETKTVPWYAPEAFFKHVMRRAINHALSLVKHGTECRAKQARRLEKAGRPFVCEQMPDDFDRADDHVDFKLKELSEEIYASCVDDVDFEIVDLKAMRHTNSFVARKLGIEECEVSTRIIRIWTHFVARGNYTFTNPKRCNRTRRAPDAVCV